MYSPQPMTVMIAVSVVMILVGHYTLRRIDPSLTIRFLLGAGMLVVAIVTLYPIYESELLLLHPVQAGVACALLGLAFNQLTAPLRKSMGKAV